MRATAGVVLLAAVLAGCATESAPAGYPLDAYRLTDQQQAQSRLAFYEVAQRCVARFGLTLPPIGDNPGRPPRTGRYGLVDENSARDWGYSLDHADGESSWVTQIDPKSRLFAVFNGREANGDPAAVPSLPDGGCQGEADRALTRGGPPRPATDLVGDLERQAVRTSRQDPKVRAATESWRQCMDRAGYDYADPVEAPYAYWGRKRAEQHPTPSARERAEGIRPGADEVRAALADVRCKGESGLLAAWTAADVACQRTLITRHQPELAQLKASLAHEVDNARRQVAGG
jgi:hypothetical protein